MFWSFLSVFFFSVFHCQTHENCTSITVRAWVVPDWSVQATRFLNSPTYTGEIVPKPGSFVSRLMSNRSKVVPRRNFPLWGRWLKDEVHFLDGPVISIVVNPRIWVRSWRIGGYCERWKFYKVKNDIHQNWHCWRFVGMKLNDTDHLTISFLALFHGELENKLMTSRNVKWWFSSWKDEISKRGNQE